MDYIKQANEMFATDYFARETTGIIIEDARPGYAKCSLVVEKKHLNANNVAMGGAVFTLADFAFGVAANLAGAPAVTLNATISYLNPARSGKITAEAELIKNGRSTCVAQMTIKDESGKLLVTSTMTGFRKTV